MQKSKLFSDVHVSVPHTSVSTTALNQTPIIASSSSAVKMPTTKQKWLVIAGCMFVFVIGASAFFPGASKPKVVVVKAPAAFSANNDAVVSTVRAATAPMAQTIASQATELAKLQQQLVLSQQQQKLLIEKMSQENARTVPVAPTRSASASGFSPPVSIDQHGVLLTVNGRPFQCSAREGAPVCISIGGYIPPVASRR
jgi:hypothetical protein